MKYILLPIILFQSFVSAEAMQLCPLQEDTPGFQTSRILIIENSVDEIERITRVAPAYIREQIDWNIMMIRLNLGYPIDEKDFLYYIYDDIDF